eukprot:204500_1
MAFNLFICQLWITCVHIGILCLSMQPTVNWYTNTDLQGNINLMKSSPNSFTGFYFCCGTWNFESDGSFVSANTKDVTDNINYFRANTNLSDLYIVGGGGLSQQALVNTPNSSFEDAINYGKSLKIDGFVVDFEPNSNSETLAQQYGLWLSRFQSIAKQNGLNVAMCTATWGILKDYNQYKPANLTYYTSMETYFGSSISYDENVVKGELNVFDKNQIRSGIGSMTTPIVKEMPYYNWTSQGLNQFLTYLKNTDVPSVDIWRSDIDYSSGYTTESWFYQDLANFVTN